MLVTMAATSRDERRAHKFADAEKPQFRERRFDGNHRGSQIKESSRGSRERRSVRRQRLPVRRRPHGENRTFEKMHARTRNFICPPHFIRCRAAAGIFQPLDSSIIANSKWPEGLSTGILPPSARISMKNAINSRMCAGEKNAGGVRDPLLLHDVRDRRLGHEGNGKKHDHKTGSARKPTMRVRLAPMGP